MKGRKVGEIETRKEKKYKDKRVGREIGKEKQGIYERETVDGQTEN